MNIFRINDYVCVICQVAIPRDLDIQSRLFAFSSRTDPTPLHQCEISITSRQEGSLMHETCLQDTRRVLSPSITPHSFLQRLRIFKDTNSPTWPIPRLERESRTRRLAGDTFSDLVKASRPNSNIHYLLGTLPLELLRRIGQLSHPSAVTTLSISRKTALLMASTSNKERSSRILFPYNRTLTPIYCSTLYRSYVTDIEDSGAPLDAGEAFIVSRDDIACTAITESHQRTPRTGLWYRKVRRDSHGAVYILYQGQCVRDVISTQYFQESFLWSQWDPPDLLPHHCFGLPATDISLEHAIQQPIRLRQVGLAAQTRGIIIACAGGRTIALQAYSGMQAELDIYERILGTTKRDNVIWFYFPLQEDETVSEVAVRTRRDSKGTMFSEPNLVLLTSLRRRYCCGFYVPPESRTNFNFQRLVNNNTLEVSEIYLNERYGSSGETRIGVLCKTSAKQLPWIHVKDFWDKHNPLSRPSSIMGHSHRYVRTIEVKTCRYFEACVENLDSGKLCLGLRFYGPETDIVLGEWRVDREILIMKLPTAAVLSNKRRNRRSCVYYCEEGNPVDSVTIEGVLEWWISFNGCEVFGFPPQHEMPIY